MTRPMQESRDKVAESQFAVRQLQRRPAPVLTAGGTAALQLSGIAQTAAGGLNVAANTWEDMVSVALNRKFTYAFDSEGASSLWSFSNTTGIVQRSETATYVFYASVDWQSIAAGDSMGVAIRVNSSAFWWRNVIVLDGGTSGVAARVAVTGALTTNLFGSGANDARAFVYCNPAATITRAEFTIRRFELVANGTEYSF